jgi:hypothetical protein
MQRLSRPQLELVCLAVTLLLLVTPASAQRIVLLRPTTADPALLQAFGRLQGELMTYDFEVIVLDAGDVAPSPRQLAQAAEQARAVASVSLIRSEGLATADVWISDRVTGKTTMRTIATAENREASSVLAVRAVDLLRTSLREISAGEGPPPEVVGASPERASPHVREWATGKPVRRRWSVEAGFVVQSTLSRLGSVYGPSISLGYDPSERVGLALGFQGPLSGAHASSERASLSLHNEQLFAEVRYRLVARARWSAEVTGAAGVHRLEVEGAARPPYVGRSDSAFTALTAAGLGLELRLAPSAALLAYGRAVLLAPRPVARMADTELSYGRPAVQAGASLHVDF